MQHEAAIVPHFRAISQVKGSARARLRDKLASGRLSDQGKTRLLSLTIREAVAARGSVTERDLVLSGLPLAEARQFYDAAMAKARAADPMLFALFTSQAA